MKNLEKKELLESLDFIIEHDCEEGLLLLIKNKIIDERMCQSKHWQVIEELVKNGYFINDLINSRDGLVRYNGFKTYGYIVYEWFIKNNKLEKQYIDLAIKQDKEDVLLLFIENQILDERMCQSKYWKVHEELAKKGCFSNALIDDKNENVRYCVYRWLIRKDGLKQEHIDLAIKQDDEKVLLLFIKNKIIDERMCQSEHLKVRQELAERGYLLNILIEDKNSSVKYCAYKWLIQTNKFQQELYVDEIVERLWKCEDKKLFVDIFESLIQYNQLKEKYIKKFVELATMCNDKGFILTLISCGINNDIKEFIDLIDVY